MAPPGKPPGSAGDLFVAVWAGLWSNPHPLTEGIHWVYSVYVTVSVRATAVPFDRWGLEVIYADAGLCYIVETIAAKLHLDALGDKVLNRANAIIGVNANGFVEPLVLIDGGQPEVKAGSWWEADNNEPRAGLAQTLSFGQAGRVQTIESAT